MNVAGFPAIMRLGADSYCDHISGDQGGGVNLCTPYCLVQGHFFPRALVSWGVLVLKENMSDLGYSIQRFPRVAGETQ